MKKNISQLFKKLFVKQWVIGISQGSIEDIIRTKIFNPNIKWLELDTIDHFRADPFPLKDKNGDINIFYEDFHFDEFYGDISIMSIDKNFNQSNHKTILDTKSHLSYPFIFEENQHIYIFPESAQSGKLSCYDYNTDRRSLDFVKDIIDLPLLDSTIIKYNGKYWLFGTIGGKNSNSRLFIFFSDNLLGPYTPHKENPVKEGSNGSRPAGNFIEVDGNLYRPSQNCQNHYGESITINKVILLDENTYVEEPYMQICINRKNELNRRIKAIHTINILDDLIIVDGLKWTFSPKNQWKNFKRNRVYLKQLKSNKIADNYRAENLL